MRVRQVQQLLREELVFGRVGEEDGAQVCLRTLLLMLLLLRAQALVRFQVALLWVGRAQHDRAVLRSSSSNKRVSGGQ